MGPKSQSSPSRQNQLKQKSSRPAMNPYSKENEIKRKAESDAKHEEGRFQRMCDQYKKSQKYRDTMTLRVDFGTMSCQQCQAGSLYKKGHHKTCHKNPTTENYKAPTSLELELLVVQAPFFLPNIPDECKKHFICRRLLDKTSFSLVGSTPEGGRTASATIETAALLALPA